METVAGSKRIALYTCNSSTRKHEVGYELMHAAWGRLVPPVLLFVSYALGKFDRDSVCLRLAFLMEDYT